METPLRQAFNSGFTEDQYQQLLQAIEADCGYRPRFRIAETPFFISKNLQQQLEEAFKQLMVVVLAPDFKARTERALDVNHRVPGEEGHPHFMAVDFGICKENGQIIPKLIEAQGFPSLFHFQAQLDRHFKHQYPLLQGLTPYFNGYNAQTYLQALDQIIKAEVPAESVILLEIEPHLQNTRIDFLYAQQAMGVRPTCVTEVFARGQHLYYRNEQGRDIRIQRIYNRVIFDELDQRRDLVLQFNFHHAYDVTWVTHPNWFFRISKYMLPWLKGPYFIDTQLLSDVREIPSDLENYVLKPLFSFSGSGVEYHVKPEHIAAVTRPDLYVLQRKVQYAPVIQAPDGGVKVEVRLLALWPDGAPRPHLATNLVRLSRGEMIGVKFNLDKTWVGGSIGLMQP